MRSTPIALALAAAGLLWLPAAAGAQDPGTAVGGTVPSTLELTIDEVGAFPVFAAGPSSRELRIEARVTSTEEGAQLSIADGDVAAGRRLGRLSGGGAPLAEPLEARVGASAFLPLDEALDPLLLVFDGPVANRRASVEIRQRIAAGERPRGTYTKDLLLTLSSTSP